MTKPSSPTDKKTRAAEIKTLISQFCETYLNEELQSYATRLSDTLSRKRKVDILRGQKEIWAASIIYVISRLNFLFDDDNENHITPDIICDFFGTKKSTIANKASQIEKICNLTIGTEGYCSPEISELFMFYETPEGLIIPKSMLGDKEIIMEFIDGEDSEELERLIEDQRRARELEAKRKKAAKSHNKNQLDLLDDL